MCCAQSFILEKVFSSRKKYALESRLKLSESYELTTLYIDGWILFGATLYSNVAKYAKEWKNFYFDTV